MAEAQTVGTLKDGFIQIVRPEHTYDVSNEPGDLTWESGLAEAVWVDDRDEQATPRLGKAGRTKVAFSVNLRDPGSEDHATLPDICEEVARPDAWWAQNTTSTLAAVSDLPTSDVVYTFDGSAKGDPDKTYTFPDMYLKGKGAEGRPNTYSVTSEGTCKGPTVT
jgi:hypothetical protein